MPIIRKPICPLPVAWPLPAAMPATCVPWLSVSFCVQAAASPAIAALIIAGVHSPPYE